MTYTDFDAEVLIWSCQMDKLAQVPLVAPTSWSGAVQIDVLNPTSISSIALNQGAADLAIAVVMMIKDEADIIKWNLDWLYFLGVRRFVIIDNDSKDSTGEILFEFRRQNSDSEMLIISDPIVRLIQSEKMTGAYHLAINVWDSCKWVFPIDADEFLIPQRGFQPLHDLSAEFDGILLAKVNHFVLRNDGPDSDPDQSPFGRMPLRTGKWAVPPKIALRANAAYRISQGNHKILRTDGAPSCYAPAGAADMFYREYQVRSYQHFKTKVTNGGRAIQKAMLASGKHPGGEHWLNWYGLYLSGGDHALQAIYERDFRQNADEGLVFDPFEPAGSRPQ